MKNLLPTLLAAATLALCTAACTPNNATTTADSTTGNAAAAADTAGAHTQIAQDKAGVQMDSAGTKPAAGTQGGIPATTAPTSQGQTK